jgi:hypothetical protein
VDEATDDRDLAGPEFAVALRLRGGRQQRLQWFAVQGLTFAEVGGIVDAAGRLGAGDPQAVGQRCGQCPAQLGHVGLFAELVDQRMLDGGQKAAYLFAALQQGQPFGCGQRIATQIQRALEVSPKRVEHSDDLSSTTRTHVRILAKPADGTSPTKPRLWIKVRLWITRQRRRPRTLAEVFRPSTRGDRA